MNRDELQAYMEQQAIRELIEKLLGILFSPITLWALGLVMVYYFFRWMLFQGIRADRYREILRKRKEEAEAEALRKAAEREAEVAELKAEKEFSSPFLFGDSLERRLAVGLTTVVVFEGTTRLKNARLTKASTTTEELTFEIEASSKRTVISLSISRAGLVLHGTIRQKPNNEPLSSYSFDGKLNEERLLEKGEIFIDHPMDDFKICFFL